METVYDMIFKRKSMRRFDAALPISKAELHAIEAQLARLIPLDAALRTAFRIVPSGQTTCRRGTYCLLCYSEHTARALHNAGYLLEQMDLLLASMNIGVCWHGIGRPDLDTWEGLPYTIMLAFGKSRPEDFRKDIRKASRKPREVIWQGTFNPDIADTARYAPSACNMQPWRVQSQENTIRVYRTTDVKSAIMPVRKRPYYNAIDLGIFLCFLEIALLHHGYAFERTLCDAQRGPENDETLIPVAHYILQAER